MIGFVHPASGYTPLVCASRALAMLHPLPLDGCACFDGCGVRGGHRADRHVEFASEPEVSEFHAGYDCGDCVINSGNEGVDTQHIDACAGACSRLAFQLAWRTRADWFYARLAAAKGGEELVDSLLADPTMARWFAASMRGLSARRVQGVRVSLPRWCRLHGIGVNRRSFVRSRQRRHVRETHCNSDIQGAWYSTGLEDAVVHGVSAFGDLGAALLATACVLDGWRRKCLQGAVVACEVVQPASSRWEGDGATYSSLLNTFRSVCANHAPSGGCAGRLASQNLYTVQHVLRRRRAYVKVLAAKSEGAFCEGRYRGWWALGQGDGVCLGTIVWYEHDGHVRAVDSVVGDGLAKLLGAAPCALVEPWSFFAAGAPKKKSMRGAHLTAVAKARAERKAAPATAPEYATGDFSPIRFGDEVDREVRSDAPAAEAAVATGDPVSPLPSGGDSGHELDPVITSGANDVCLNVSACEETSSGEGHVLQFGDESDYEAHPELHCGRPDSADSASSSLQFGDGKRRGKRRKRGPRASQKADLVEESKPFLPLSVDKSRCLALLWNGGRGQLQCANPAVMGSFCRVHRACRSHGTVDGSEPIPRRKLDLFRERLGKPRGRGGHWYARHLMWHFAVSIAPDAEYLTDLSAEQYEQCLQKVHTYVNVHKGLQRKYERDAGVRGRDDRDTTTAYGSARERYNGVGGGEVFRWFTRPVFESYLARMGVSVENCSERQCMLALQATSEELRKYDVVTEQLRPYAGPQCYPHLDRTNEDCRIDCKPVTGGTAIHGNLGAHGADASLAREQCWRCCDSCGKWRLVDHRCLPALAAEEGFFEDRETDLDWGQWLTKASFRYDRLQEQWEAEVVDVAGAGLTTMSDDASGAARVKNGGDALREIDGGAKKKYRKGGAVWLMGRGGDSERKS